MIGANSHLLESLAISSTSLAPSMLSWLTNQLDIAGGGMHPASLSEETVYSEENRIFQKQRTHRQSAPWGSATFTHRALLRTSQFTTSWPC